MTKDQALAGLAEVRTAMSWNAADRTNSFVLIVDSEPASLIFTSMIIQRLGDRACSAGAVGGAPAIAARPSPPRARAPAHRGPYRAPTLRDREQSPPRMLRRRMRREPVRERHVPEDREDLSRELAGPGPAQHQ